ncbi:MAG: hypothetical protein Q8S73_11600 [Deltaproteobacteria bacterium]|nr:hypothetical protein [Deltaproteobacteria bacterium]
MHRLPLLADRPTPGRDMSQVTIEVDADLIETGEQHDYTKRVSNFFERTGIARRTFELTWQRDAALPVSFQREVLSIPGLQSLGARQGDRLVLEASTSSGTRSRASLLDGSAVFLEHLLARADPASLARLAAIIPTTLSKKIDAQGRVPSYAEARNLALYFLLEQWVGGPASAERFNRMLQRRGSNLVFLTNSESVAPYASVFRYGTLENLKGSLVAILHSAQEVFGDLPEDLRDGARSILAGIASGDRPE